MCGQYSFVRDKLELLERYPDTELSVNLNEEDDREIYYPGQDNVILLPNNKFYEVQWGFIPSFSRKPIINARLETILEKKLFIEPFMQKRCIIPATSFYEFEDVVGQKYKRRWQISVEGTEIFSMAGVCERYLTKDNKSVLTYSILTKESSGQMAEIHHRVPVILTKDLENDYLNLENKPNILHQKLLAVTNPLSFEIIND